jgi:tetratricopeptide (TPR) repeat protein
VLHPQEVALLQTLVRSGRLTPESARAFAQGLETRRAKGEKPSLVDALVANRVASPEEIAGALRQTAAKTAAVALGPQRPPTPVVPDPDSPTVRTGSGPESFIRAPKRRDSDPPGTEGPGFTERYPGGRPAAPTRPVYTPPSSAQGPVGYDSSIPRSGWSQTPPNEAVTLADPNAGAHAPPFSPPSAAPAPSGGPFALETRINDGTLGEVWRARHAALRRTLAVKIIRTSGLPPAELERLLGEARAAMKAKHPNIAQVHQVGNLPDGRPFIAMDFIDGPSLAQTLESRTLGAAEVARVGAKIAAALQAAHEQGVVHGDVRPENILLDERSEPFLADFGLGREEEEGDLRFRGTAGYVAPEQVAQAPVPAPASDTYSLGATLYHCLTRQPPFKAESPMATARLALKGKPVRPTKIEPTVPPELEAVIMKALEKDPARRYGNVGMLGEDLRRFLDGRPLEAKPVGGLFASASIFVAALAALVVILGGATAVLVVRKVALEKHVKELEDLEAKGDWTELEGSARALAQERPDEPRAQRHLAYALVGERKGAEALDAAKQAGALSADGPEDVIALGVANLAADRQEDARAAFEKALAVKPLAPAVEARALAGLAIALAYTDAKAGKEKAEKALALVPEDAAVAALAGRALLLCREPKAALEALKKAAAARPKDESVLTDKAVAVAATGDASGALSDLDSVLSQHQDYVPGLVARARIKLATGDNQQAADDADRARNVDQNAREAHLVAALALTWLGRFDDAESRVQDLQKLAPAELTSAIAKAVLSIARGKPEDASVALRDAPAPAKKESGLLVSALRSLALRQAFRPDEARNEAEQVIRNAAGEASWLLPGDDDSIAQATCRRYGFSAPESTGHALKAEALHDMQRIPDAKIEVDAAKRAVPVAPRAALADGLCQLASNDLQGALRTADQAIQSTPDLAVLHELRALVRIQMKGPSLALTDIDQAIKLEPANYMPHYLRAQVRLQMGDASSALQELEQAERFAPKARPDIYAVHANLLLQTGRLQEARKMAEKGLVADQRHADCLFVRGVARCYMGDERFDEDLKAALQTPAGRSRADMWVNYLELLLNRGRVAEVDQGTTQLLEQIKMQQGGGGQVRLQLVFLRASARALMPERWKEGVEDANALIEVQPENTAFLSIRGFILAALDQAGYADDAKKCANAPPQIMQMMLQRGEIAARSKLAGNWLAFYSAVNDAASAKELKAGCWQLVALVADVAGKPEEALAALERAFEIAPSDQLKQTIDQLKGRKK